jgi:hypothetical protein
LPRRASAGLANPAARSSGGMPTRMSMPARAPTYLELGCLALRPAPPPAAPHNGSPASRGEPPTAALDPWRASRRNIAKSTDGLQLRRRGRCCTLASASATTNMPPTSLGRARHARVHARARARPRVPRAGSQRLSCLYTNPPSAITPLVSRVGRDAGRGEGRGASPGRGVRQ